jgi:hypothetical protein
MRAATMITGGTKLSVMTVEVTVWLALGAMELIGVRKRYTRS